MNVVEKQSLNITVEGDEVQTLKSAIKVIIQEEEKVGFCRCYPLNEKEVKLLRDIEKQINK